MPLQKKVRLSIFTYTEAISNMANSGVIGFLKRAFIKTKDIIDSAVTTDKLNDSAVTPDKIGLTSTGDMIFRNSSGVTVALPIGSTDEVITVVGGIPAYAEAGGGSWEIIATATASTSSSIDFTSGITSAFSEFVIVVSNMKQSTQATCKFRISTDGGSTFKAGGSDYIWQSRILKTAGDTHSQSNGDTSVLMTGNTPFESGRSVDGRIHIIDPSDSSGGVNKAVTWSLSDTSTTTSARNFGGVGFYKTATTAVDGFRIIPTSGTITSGEFALYGIKNT